MGIEDPELTPVEAPVGIPAEEPAPELPKDAMSAWNQWKLSPNPQNMSAVLKRVSPVIDKSIARFPNFNSAVLGGEAKRLAIQAIKTFDPAESASLSTHVFNHMRPLARYTQSVSRAISIPDRARAELGRLKRAEQDFYEENNRYASDAELQDITGLPAKKLGKIRQLDRFELAEGALEAPPEQAEEDGKMGLWADYVYHDLGTMDKAIMDHRVGRNGKQILETDELAKRLKVHPTYVNRRAGMIAQRILDGMSGGKQ